MKSYTLAFVVFGAGLLAPVGSGQTHFATIYTISGDNPLGLTQAKGVLYGATNAPISGGNCGNVFELQPPAAPGGAWTESVLHTFTSPGGDACGPTAAPLLGANGALYGVSGAGGANNNSGAAYQLQPPTSPGGPWAESVIYSFNIGPGGPSVTGQPTSITLGPDGTLYVTACCAGSYFSGSLYQLTPPTAPGGTWAAIELYSFMGGSDGSGPNSLTRGPGGALYGTTQLSGSGSSGTVFEAFPPSVAGGAWTESVLYAFQGLTDGAAPNSVIRGLNGTLYGSTLGRLPVAGNGDGTVFQLTPPTTPGAPWTKTILANFGQRYDCGPDSPLIQNNGNLYGTACQPGGGVVFELQPPSAPGGAWTLNTLHTFTNGQVPGGAMVLHKGILYGATIAPINQQPGGTIYAIKLK